MEFYDLHAQSENDGGRPHPIKGAGVSEHVANGGGSDVVEFFGGDSGHFISPCALLSGRAPGRRLFLLPPMVAKGAFPELADGAADGASLGRQSVAEAGRFAGAVYLSEVFLFAWFRGFIRHGVPLPC